MVVITIPVLDLFSEEELKEKLKFYTITTISKDIVEIELECLIDDKEYKNLIRILYG